MTKRDFLPTEDEVILRAENITMVFPGTLALDNVNFNVRRGKVNVLVGENGAGKSTLMKILAGVQKPTEGKLILEGKEVQFESTRDAASKGIGIVFQELNLFPNMSVAENIFITRELVRNGAVDLKEQEDRTRLLMQRLEQEVDPKALVSSLRIGVQQIVEIAKALSQDAQILIMDEPTSALSKNEVRILFRIIQELKTQGVAIIYISHRLEEVTEIGDWITVLRDGCLQSEKPVDEIDVNWIIRQMVGREPVRSYHDETRTKGKEVLRVENMSLNQEGGGYWVDHVSFSVRAGEILGIYGLMGAGRSELLDCLLGAYPKATGKLWIEGQEIRSRTISDRIRAGLSLVPEDRQREGLVPILSVAQNMTLSSLWRYLRNFTIASEKEADSVQEMIGELSIKVSSPQVDIGALSGGNQQKVVIGKNLLTLPKVLLMDEPTRGIDVGAKADVFRIMSNLEAKGVGIIFVSSDLNEILTIADRIIVMSNGKITENCMRSEATEEKLVAASAIGH